jgi:hypothetical protein
MGIIGSPLWNDRERAYFTQENNAFEHMLKCLLPPGVSWLETCGPTASLNCQASLGRDVGIKTKGGYSPQPEDLLTAYFNDPNNFEALRAAWPALDPEGLPGNEVAQWYPHAVRAVFGNVCEFVGALTFDQAVDHIRGGRTIQASLKKPGHYIALVAYDETRAEFIIKDSWASRWADHDGFCKPLTLLEYETNVRPRSIVYS